MEETRSYNLMYVGAVVGIKTKKGTDMHLVNLMEIIKNDHSKTEAGKGKLIGQSKDCFYFDDEKKLFVQGIIDKGYEFGDIVECEFTFSNSLSRPPELVSINKLVAKSPYNEILFPVGKITKA